MRTSGGVKIGSDCPKIFSEAPWGDGQEMAGSGGVGRSESGRSVRR